MHPICSDMKFLVIKQVKYIWFVHKRHEDFGLTEDIIPSCFFSFRQTSSYDHKHSTMTLSQKNQCVEGNILHWYKRIGIRHNNEYRITKYIIYNGWYLISELLTNGKPWIAHFSIEDILPSQQPIATAEALLINKDDIEKNLIALCMK